MDHVISAGVLDIAISDHLPIFMIKKKQKSPSSNFSDKARTYVKYKKSTFQEEIRWHPNWGNFWDKQEEMWDTILEIIKEIADRHCPVKNMKMVDKRNS